MLREPIGKKQVGISELDTSLNLQIPTFLINMIWRLWENSGMRIFIMP